MPVVIQAVQFHWDLWNWNAVWCFKNDYSKSLLIGACSTVLQKPVIMVFNAESHVHTPTINSFHISTSAAERIKTDRISSVVVVMFPNIVPWMVVWCFGSNTAMFRGSGSLQKCQHEVSRAEVSQRLTSSSKAILKLNFQLSRLKRSMRSEIRRSVGAG